MLKLFGIRFVRILYEDTLICYLDALQTVTAGKAIFCTE
jgi:hypothetical protein